MTIISAFIILAFSTIEFFDYRRVGVDTSIVVDRSRGQKLSVRLNVTFPHVPCYCERYFPHSWMCLTTRLSLSLLTHSVLSLDVMDISGEQQRDISHNILKKRVTKTGVDIPAQRGNDLRNEIDKLAERRASGYCGSCYGGVEPESGCCNSCEDVRQAYVNKGWSFSNPDSIEQVGNNAQYPWNNPLMVSGDSASRKVGQISLRTRQMRGVMCPDVFELTRSSEISTLLQDVLSRQVPILTTIWCLTFAMMVTHTISPIQSTSFSSWRMTSITLTKRRLGRK